MIYYTKSLLKVQVFLCKKRTKIAKYTGYLNQIITKTFAANNRVRG